MTFFVSSLRSVVSIAIAATLLLGPSSAAYEPSPVLKFVYFVPSNIAFDPNAYAAMQTIAADFAAWNRLYFNGNAPDYTSEYVFGDHTWEWYVYNREEYNRIFRTGINQHDYYLAAALSHDEIMRKLKADPFYDRNLKHIVFMHEDASPEDTSECSSEDGGVVWMSYENIQLVQTQRTRPPIVLAHEVGHVWGLLHEGLPGDCMFGGLYNANKTCNYSPSNQEKILANYGKFFLGTNGRNISTLAAPPVCEAKIGDFCTGTNGVRSCCPPEGYCQPMSSTSYQCVTRPEACSDQLTDTDYYGNDILRVHAATSGECCNLCGLTKGCHAYTYYFAGAVGIEAGSCYLKSAAGATSKTNGAVSGVILADWSTVPCTSKVGDSCNKNSVNIRGCCPSGSYCMPWSPGDYKCESIPSQCSVQHMDSRYDSLDMQVVTTRTPDLCCDACAQTEGCKAYTYYARAVGSRAAGSCCLTSNDQQVTFKQVGAVSGSAITREACKNTIGDSCVADPCCPSQAYCQPLGTNSSQCMRQPTQCATQLPNVDYAGNDITMVTAQSADQCCEACSLNPQCNAYSYYLFATGGRGAGACYLKSAAGAVSYSAGAVSGSVTTRLGCQAKIGDACGFNSCCMSDGYCQPLPDGSSHCLNKPTKCAIQVPNVDYIGNDVGMVARVPTADKCCEACSQVANCNAYSYYQFTTGGRTAGDCFLKSAAGATAMSN